MVKKSNLAFMRELQVLNEINLNTNALKIVIVTSYDNAKYVGKCMQSYIFFRLLLVLKHLNCDSNSGKYGDEKKLFLLRLALKKRQNVLSLRQANYSGE